MSSFLEKFKFCSLSDIAICVKLLLINFCCFLIVLKTTSQQVQVIVSAEEFGAKEKSPYNSYICSDIPSSSLSDIIR